MVGLQGERPKEDQERLWGRGHLNKQSKGAGRDWRNCTSEGGRQESTGKFGCRKKQVLIRRWQAKPSVPQTE